MRSVLVVGKDPVLPRRVAALLGKDGRVLTATSCSDGLAVLNREPVVQVLLGRFGKWCCEDRDRAFAEFGHISRIEVRERVRLEDAAHQINDEASVRIISPDIGDPDLYQTLHLAFSVFDLRRERNQLRRPSNHRPAPKAVEDAAPNPVGSLLRDEYLLMIAHDLRAPLAVITGYAELLLATETHLGEQGRQAIQRIRSNGQRLMDMVSNMLRMPSSAAGLSLIQTEPCRLADLGRAVVEDLSPLAEAKGQILTLHVAGDDREYRLDRLSLGHVLHNLVTNSIKFTPRGGRIALSIAGDAAKVTFTVSDNGKGMSAEKTRRLRNPESRIVLRDSAKGGGLGFSIVRRIVALHGGEIGIESRPHEGTTVTFTVKPE